MVKETVKGELENALELDPAFYLEELKKRLTDLVDAYDHLDKVISVFESYQLPLPGIDGKDAPPPDKNQTKLEIRE